MCRSRGATFATAPTLLALALAWGPPPAPADDIAGSLRQASQQLKALADKVERADRERSREARSGGPAHTDAAVLLKGFLDGKISMNLHPGLEIPAEDMVFLVVRPGSFRMGRTHEETIKATQQSRGSFHHNFSEPPRQVTVLEPYFLADREVTNAQYYWFYSTMGGKDRPPLPPLLEELTSKSGAPLNPKDERWQYPVTHVT